MQMRSAILSPRTASPYARAMHEVAPVPDDSELARRIVAAGTRHDAAAEAELCRRFAPRIRLYGLRHLRSDAAPRTWSRTCC
jgi:RNA polymerase sigma-70 factor (ECF subfamily)